MGISQRNYFYLLLLASVFIITSIVSCIKEEEKVVQLLAVSTRTASAITTNGVVSGGDIVYFEGMVVSSYGLCWNEHGNPKIEDNVLYGDSSGLGFNSQISNLSSNTKYYLRAFAKSPDGISYGNVISFKTTHEKGIVALNALIDSVAFTSTEFELSTIIGSNDSLYLIKGISNNNSISIYLPDTISVGTYLFGNLGEMGSYSFVYNNSNTSYSNLDSAIINVSFYDSISGLVAGNFNLDIVPFVGSSDTINIINGVFAAYLSEETTELP